MRRVCLFLCLVVLQLVTRLAYADSEADTVLSRIKASIRQDVMNFPVRLICDRSEKFLAPSQQSTARFKLHKNGRITIDTHAPSNTIMFEGAHPVAKLQSVPSNGNDAATVACGAVLPSTVYELPAQRTDLITVFVFDDVDHDQKYLAEYRLKALADMRQAERDAVHSDSSLQRLVTVVRAMSLNPDDATIDAAIAATNHAHDAMAATERKFGCAVSSSDEILLPAICDEVLGLDLAISSLKVIVPRIKSAAQTIEDRQKALASNNVNALVASIKPAPPLSRAVQKLQCSRIERYRWLDLKQTPRLSTVATLPLSAEVSYGEYGQAIDPVDAAFAGAGRALLVTSIPYGQTIKFAEVKGDRTTLAAAQLFSTFIGQARGQILPPLTSALNLSAMTLDFVQEHASKTLGDLQTMANELLEGAPRLTQEDVSIPEKRRALLNKLLTGKTVQFFRTIRRDALLEYVTIGSILCDDEVVLMKDDFPSEEGQAGISSEALLVKIDGDLPASSGIEHRAYIFKLDRDHKMIVALCAGSDCTGKDDDKQVKTRVALTPSRAHSFTLLAEISGGIGIRSGTTHDSGFPTMSTPQFNPVFGPEGPDQIYEMQQKANPADAISTSLLLAFHLSDGNLVAIGPSLTTGASGNAFKQWNLRWGYEFANGFAVTAGGSVRAVPFPEDYKIGDRVSVPRGMNTKPPDIRTYYTPVLQLEVGLAFDLNGLASLASNAYAAIGGK